MHRYLYLLTTYVLHKWALIIITACGLVFNFGIFYTTISFGSIFGETLLDKLPGMMFIVTFTFTSLFSVFVYNYLFKDGEKDGSELIILTKPITRTQLFLCKIIVLIGYIFLNSLLYLFIFTIVGTSDNVASSSLKASFIMSAWFGSFIVQLLFAPLMILIGTTVGKTGVLVITLVMTALLPISSMIMQPLGSGLTVSGDFTENYDEVYGYAYNSFNLSTITNDSETFGVNNTKINSSDSSITFLKTPGTYYVNDTFVPDKPQVTWNNPKAKTNTELFNDYEEAMWYDTYAYFDVWYQWSRFYQIFVTKDKLYSEEPMKLEKVTKRVSMNNNAGISVNVNGVPTTYIVQFTPTKYGNTVSDYFNNPIIFGDDNNFNSDDRVKPIKNDSVVAPHLEKIWALMAKTDSEVQAQTNLDTFMSINSLSNRVNVLAVLIDNLNSSGTKYDSINYLRRYVEQNGPVRPRNLGEYIFENAAILYKLVEQKYSDSYIAPTTINFKKNKTQDQESGEYTNLNSERFIKNNSSLSSAYEYAIQKKEYLPTWGVVLLWVILGFALYGLSFWRYTKIDFR